MPAFGDNGLSVWTFANDTSEGNAFQQFVFVVVFILLSGLACTFALRDHPPIQLLSLGADFPIAIKLPALFIAFAAVQEFT